MSPAESQMFMALLVYFTIGLIIFTLAFVAFDIWKDLLNAFLFIIAVIGSLAGLSKVLVYIDGLRIFI